MSTAIERYRDIICGYYAGEFGDKHLYLQEILALAGEPDLFDKMTAEDITDLIEEAGNISLKIALAQIRNMKCGPRK